MVANAESFSAGLSVNKLWGFSQAAYFTFSSGLAGTHSNTIHWQVLPSHRARNAQHTDKSLPVPGNKRALDQVHPCPRCRSTQERSSPDGARPSLCCLTHMAHTSESHDKLPDQKYCAVFYSLSMCGVWRGAVCVDRVHIKVSLFLSLSVFSNSLSSRRFPIKMMDHRA